MSLEDFFCWSDHEVRKKSASSWVQEMPGRPPQPWGSRKGGWLETGSLPALPQQHPTNSAWQP